MQVSFFLVLNKITNALRLMSFFRQEQPVSFDPPQHDVTTTGAHTNLFLLSIRNNKEIFVNV